MAKLHLSGTMLFVLFVCTWSTKEQEFAWDENGYVIFCLCMGRFGNQADHFLGGLSFAKKLNRTLVLPPWRTHKNVPFTEFFKLKPMLNYHRVIVAEDFMQYLAPTHWPQQSRIGMCYNLPNKKECDIKVGNPFGSFWDGLGVDFDKTETYHCSYTDHSAWLQRFPVKLYPVLALKGAPAKYPIEAEDRHLQKYLEWSNSIAEEGLHVIDSKLRNRKFLGIHLRNGVDWQSACKHSHGRNTYMSSPQCLDPQSGGNVTMEMCYPATQEVLESVRKVLESNNDIRMIYVATDKSPLTKELTEELTDLNVTVYHHDPWIPQIDLYILGQADIFIGNCVSSFTAFVARERAVHDKVSLFWGSI